MTVSEVTSLRHPPEKVVSFVRRLIDGYKNHSGPERRSQPRQPVAILVSVQPLDDDLHPIGDPFTAITKDISGGGVGLLHSEVVTATHVQIEFTSSDQERMDILAHVRHCTPHGQSYHIGARFVVDWSLYREDS